MTVWGAVVLLTHITSVPGGTLITFGLNPKTPLLFVVMCTVTFGGGGGGGGVGPGVGDGVGLGIGVGDGVGLGTDVGNGVGCAAEVAVGDGVAWVVAVGLVSTDVVGEVTGVLPIPEVGLLTMAVGVVPVFVVGELPPHAATSVSRPNNTRLNKIPGCDTCFRSGIFLSPAYPPGDR